MHRDLPRSLLASALFGVIWFVAAFAAGQEPEPSTDVIPLTDLGYADETLTRDQARAEYWWPIPENWELDDASQLKLVISFPPTTNVDARGMLEVRVNTEPPTKIDLPPGGSDLSWHDVPLPHGLPTPAGLHIVAEYLPRGEDEDCEEPDERYVNVHAMSQLSVARRIRPARSDLGALPYPFAYQRARAPIQVLFALPQEPSVAVLDAAANVAAWLGRSAGGSPLQFATTLHAKLDEVANASVVVIGEDPMELPSKWRSETEACVGSGVEPSAGTATLSMCANHGDKGRLVVMGRAPAIAHAVAALAGPGPLVGKRRTVTGPPPAAKPNPWTAERVSLQDLEAGDVELRSLGKQQRVLYFKRPRGWQLGAKSSLDIHVRASGSLREGSELDVELNGSSLESLPLESVARWHRLSFPDTSQLNRKLDGTPEDHLVLKFVVNHQLEDQQEEDCDPREGDAFTLVLKDSYFELHPDLDEPSLTWFPFPFANSRTPTPVTIVVPAEDRAYLDAALRIGSEIGRGAWHPHLAVRIGSAFDETVARGHVVIVGDRESPWLRQLSVTGIATERPSLPAGADVGPPIGQIFVARSPWSDGGTVLTLESRRVDAPQLALALQAKRLTSTRLLVDADGATVAVGVDPSAAASAPNAVVAWLADARNQMVLALAFVNFLMVGAFLWSRRRARSRALA